ncbi:MAG: hypothetical protein M1828_003323 [Chrysothrix sp. TS-e1954]|nr:MAG: hypothetical protein M1828_003323 [Chrysothrix sp. TS-e1954]
MAIASEDSDMGVASADAPHGQQAQAEAAFMTNEDKPENHDSFAGSVAGSEGAAVNGDGAVQGQEDEATRLQGLSATVRDQTDLEKDIGRQADQMLTEQADERDQRRLSKTMAQKEKLQVQLRKLQTRLRQPGNATAAGRIKAEVEDLESQITELEKDLKAIEQRMSERHQTVGEEEADQESKTNHRMAGESKRDFLIRTGKITPFSKLGQMLKPSDSLTDVMLDAEEFDEDGNQEEEEDHPDEHVMQPLSHTNLLRPGFEEEHPTSADAVAEEFDLRPRKKRRLIQGSEVDHGSKKNSKLEEDEGCEATHVSRDDDEDAEIDDSSESEFGVIFEGTDEQVDRSRSGSKRNRRTRRVQAEDSTEDLAGVDDGNEQLYQSRLRKWIDGRKTARRKAIARRRADLDREDGQEQDDSIPDNEAEELDEPEWRMPHPTRESTVFNGGLLIPGDIYSSLFDYQKTGVQWLWELYTQQVGGIIGDEMGLGKTIQAISFLAGLHHSGKYNKPTIVVAPATVMKQWVNEFHRWWPAFRVSILHTSGSGMLDVRREKQLDDELDSYGFARSTSKAKTSSKSARKIVDRVLAEGHILVTTYSGLQSYASLLIPIEWGYAILDEGHKIRNPNTAITIYCKELRTPNRIILSGTPMQNNLTELWSLFDFVYPMRLGTLVNFRTQFEIPIKQGGYANASNLQVETAYNCAETLKEAISPYLLQRFKVDVAADLPKKSEQVLFCKLTKPQRQAYETFLASPDMSAILDGKRQSLFGIDILRKICNHPDLQDHKTLSIKPGYPYGQPNKSGKMQVVKALLQLWKETGHKTLLFAQHRIMLNIMEPFLKSLPGLRYLRMDGTTPIAMRQSFVDTFNNDLSIDLFLLTTKVGGLGVNLTGADRVIIYDPDWNPSTDVQARERAWRLGQKREVLIYRLMTAGTIEEKIYHRQIFKQFLTNKILRDPKQRQTFQLKDLHDLFVLGDANEGQTETSGLFKGTEVKYPSAGAQDPQELKAQASRPDADTEADASKISAMPGISRQAPYRTSSPPPSTGAPSNSTNPTPSTSSTKDSRLLTTLLPSSIHSTHSHDAIISTNSTSGARQPLRADPEIISREARRIAAEAAKELRRAGEEARSIPAGVPTWTGTVGVAGRPDPGSSAIGDRVPARGGGAASRGRGGRGGGGGGGGPSSAAVLANLSARQGGPSTSASAQNGDHTDDTQQPKGKDFLALIRQYLLLHGGRTPTQMLIDHFNRFCGTPQRVLEFKEMLRQIAVLEKPGADGGAGGRARGAGAQRRNQARRAGRGGSAGGRGIWVLREEFGGTA